MIRVTEKRQKKISEIACAYSLKTVRHPVPMCIRIPSTEYAESFLTGGQTIRILHCIIIINISEIESCIDKKDVYVKLSKAIYTDDNLYKIVRKIIQKKNVEYEEKIELFREIREAYGEDGFRE